jgi:tripartite-type tricarboxylate transporter receptor subunit TctC
MKPPRRVFLRLAFRALAFGILCATLFAPGAWSQSANAIKVVVPYPPAGGADVLARIVADAIGTLHGPPMVILNRPGAGTMIGTEDVARAKPDGNTLLISNNALAIFPHLRKLDYDPLASLQPICGLATTPTIMIVNSPSPYRSLSDLISAARARPGTLTFGATPGAKSNIDFEMIRYPAAVQMTLVPFNGTPPIVNAVLGGQVDAAFVDLPAAAGLLQAGKLRALVTGSRERVKSLPEVPTVSESGFGDFEMEVWYGVLAPVQAPAATVSQLADWFAKALRLPETRSRLAVQGMNADGVCGAGAAAHLHKLNDDYGRFIRDAGIKPE